ncbi:1-deoxy-D-xylulose-5-phosphate synthase [Clostridium sp. D2Q-11]|uniref:1-deoxy-D-xylulose-5-phosphate synthase n=1 Tax=Anaeromonas frigoriresistens TaxID=2683708 RepID=A0A942UYK3_9FIRM|nr:1-deoxy-D-xylulose-5-phosphate synthase [Anaeromonas frigoriresistens]MBS4539980.1 1-deoxy-D-xylulose-5-phosphate synthase [Anaeromonas frigoriresistens]
MKTLDKVNCISDVKKLDITELNKLSGEIRKFLLDNVSKTGGHVASNLGVVELTIAIHKVFNSPEDKIIWDVGHQSYIHKILTGRKDRMHTIRQYEGLSGFPKRCESFHDTFETGHSSTSISAGLGMAIARDIKGEKNEVVSIIGDGSMTAGMAFEALNHAGDIKSKMIVILNDNEMSISKNVGGLSKYLDRIRTAPTYGKMKDDVETLLNSIPAIGKTMYRTAERAKDSLKYFLLPGILFEELGFKYLGPVDGHNIPLLIKTLNRAKLVNGPVIVHVLTKKGKGYKHAEENPDKFHGASAFDLKTGKALSKTKGVKYSKVFGDKLYDLAKNHKDIVAITAAMPSGTGLENFKNKLPKRFIDVGIAEQHAVTFAAGLASQGLKSYFAVYSTFLQRGYDQVLHDVCLQNLPVVFAIDRAGLVGNDGETHHGVFDFSYLSHIPNLIIMAPKDKKELEEMVEFTYKYNDGPIAIRYPRGVSVEKDELITNNEIVLGKGEMIKEGKNVAIIAIGKMVDIGYEASLKLEESGLNPTLINIRFLKPIDNDLIKKVSNEYNMVVTLEDNVISGGLATSVNNELFKYKYKGNLINIGLPDEFIEHGNTSELFKKHKLDADGIYDTIINSIKA